MRRSLMLVLAVALAALVFAPAAFAQDDNPTGDDVMASPAATTSATASATPTATATPTAAAGGDDDAAAAVGGNLPRTGGVSLLWGLAGLLLVGSGIIAAMLMRRTS